MKSPETTNNKWTSLKLLTITKFIKIKIPLQKIKLMKRKLIVNAIFHQTKWEDMVHRENLIPKMFHQFKRMGKVEMTT